MRLTSSRAYTRPTPVPKMPPGLVELMEGLARDVIKNNPPNIYEFCANHMEKLLEIRDGPSTKERLTLDQKILKAQEKVRQRALERQERFDRELKLQSKNSSEDIDESSRDKMDSVINQNNSSIPSLKAPIYHVQDLEQSSEVEISHTSHEDKVPQSDVAKIEELSIADEDKQQNNSPIKIIEPETANNELINDESIFGRVEKEAVNAEVSKEPEILVIVQKEVVESHLQTITEDSDENQVSNGTAVIPEIVIGDEHGVFVSEDIAEKASKETELNTVIDIDEETLEKSHINQNDSKDKSEALLHKNTEGVHGEKSIALLLSEPEVLIQNQSEDLIRNKPDVLIRNKSEDPLESKSEDLIQNKSENPLQTKYEELIQIKSENPLQSKSEELTKNKSENPLQSKSEELIQNKSEDPLQSKSEELIPNKSEVPLQSKSEELIQNKSDVPLQSRREDIIENKSEDPLQSKSEEHMQNKSEDLLQRESEDLIQNNSNDSVASSILTDTLDDSKSPTLINSVNNTENIMPDDTSIGTDTGIVTSQISRGVFDNERHRINSVSGENSEMINIPISTDIAANISNIANTHNSDQQLDNDSNNIPTDGRLNNDNINIEHLAEDSNNEQSRKEHETSNISKYVTSIEDSLEQTGNETAEKMSEPETNTNNETNLKETNVEVSLNTEVDLNEPILKSEDEPNKVQPKEGPNNTDMGNADYKYGDNGTRMLEKSDSNENTNEDSMSILESDLSKTDDDSLQNNPNDMNLETAAVTIQKVFRSFMFKSRNNTFEDATNDENNSIDEENDKKEEYYAAANLNKERRPLGITRMDTVLQTVNEEKSLSLSTDDSSTLSSAATTIQAHVRGFLVRNRLNSSKTFSMNSLVNSHEVLETEAEQHKNKTILNIHIVPEEGNYLSRDESLFTSMDLSLDGSPPSSVNLHPLSQDTTERRKMLKREDAIQSVSPPSNNSGKLSEDSVKEALINEDGLLDPTDDKTNEIDDLEKSKVLDIEAKDIISSTSTVTPSTIITISKSEEPVGSPREYNEEVLQRNGRSFTKLSSDESDVITPFVPSPRSAENSIRLVHSGEFHDVVLPTKVSRNDTSVVREFKTVLVYFLLWNN